MTSTGGRKEVSRKGPAERDMTIVTKVSGTSIVGAGEGSMGFLATIIADLRAELHMGFDQMDAQMVTRDAHIEDMLQTLTASQEKLTNVDTRLQKVETQALVVNEEALTEYTFKLTLSTKRCRSSRSK
jgi:hypothetical protein